MNNFRIKKIKICLALSEKEKEEIFGDNTTTLNFELKLEKQLQKCK